MISPEVPPTSGLGLKPRHIRRILEERPRVGWFEVHPENYMGEGGPPHRQLEAIRARYPLSLHGVGLSIGGEGALDEAHLARLRALVRRYEPGLVSEHLAWSTHEGVYYNDLLPMPYSEATLGRVVDHVGRLQEAVGRRILLENPSSYVAFEESTHEEPVFLAEVARRTGCGLLLDLNNVFVSAHNLGFTPESYISAFALERVGEIHLGGHDQRPDGLLIDAHDRPVADPVWALLDHVLDRTGPLPVLVEWDNDVPDWPVLHAEARRVQRLLDGCRHVRAG